MNYGCFDVQFFEFFRPTQIDNFSHRNVYISAIDRVKNTIEASRKAQFLVFHVVWVVLSFHSKVHKISDYFKKSSFAAHFIHIFSNLSMLFFLIRINANYLLVGFHIHTMQANSCTRSTKKAFCSKKWEKSQNFGLFFNICWFDPPLTNFEKRYFGWEISPNLKYVSPLKTRFLA